MDFKVSSRRYGDTVEFEVTAAGIKEALIEAKRTASLIFEYNGTGEEPKVSVKPMKEKE